MLVQSGSFHAEERERICRSRVVEGAGGGWGRGRGGRGRRGEAARSGSPASVRRMGEREQVRGEGARVRSGGREDGVEGVGAVRHGVYAGLGHMAQAAVKDDASAMWSKVASLTGAWRARARLARPTRFSISSLDSMAGAHAAGLFAEAHVARTGIDVLHHPAAPFPGEGRFGQWHSLKADRRAKARFSQILSNATPFKINMLREPFRTAMAELNGNIPLSECHWRFGAGVGGGAGGDGAVVS